MSVQDHDCHERTLKPEAKEKAQDITAVMKTLSADGDILGSSNAVCCLVTFIRFLHTLWLFTKDDFDTFVIPNTIFGLSAALSKELVPSAAYHLQAYNTLRRLPLVIFFNWSNLLIFDLANQRLPDSIREDMINKPWRPLPAGRISPQQTRRMMIIAMLLVMLSNYLLGVWKETALLFNLTWIYNDLGGGDDNWLVRNINIAIAYFLYNLGSLRIASGASGQAEVVLGIEAFGWTAVISAVILTTMQVQDLKDQEGDRAHERQTAPLVLGESMARWTIAIPVLFWSFACALFWGLWTLPIVIGSYVAYRVLWQRGRENDRRSWKVWCLWTAVLYILPLAFSLSEKLSSS